MREDASFELGFYNENSGIVTYEDAGGGDDTALVSFALLALRVWRNMGKNNTFADASASMLATLSDPSHGLDAVRALPHPSDRDLAYIVKRMREAVAQAPSAVGPILQMHAKSRPEFKVVEWDGGRARRRFVGVIEERNGVYTLNLSVKGFGLLGSGLNYYAPAAIFLFLHHAATQVLKRKSAHDRLGRVAELCAMARLEGEATVVNQPVLAAQIVAEVRRDAPKRKAG